MNSRNAMLNPTRTISVVPGGGMLSPLAFVPSVAALLWALHATFLVTFPVPSVKPPLPDYLPAIVVARASSQCAGAVFNSF